MNINELPTITFEQTWLGPEWAARQSFNGSELNEQLANIRTPKTDICESLAKMHDCFYPNERHKSIEDAKKYLQTAWTSDCSDLRYDRYLPWVLHQALAEAKDNKNNVSSKPYDGIIEYILKREWLLSWHWRAVLHRLSAYDQLANDEKLIIQISHVRKWEMLLCYSVKSKDLRRRRIADIPLKNKTLLRAPLFALSHRLKGWDTYRLFYHSDIEGYISAETKEVRKRQTNKQMAEAYILGRHDCYYIVDTFQSDGTTYKWNLRISMDPQPEKTLIDKTILGDRSYYYGPTDLIDIPSFGDGQHGIPQLLSSDNYCEAIVELTEVLNDPTARSVLLIAPPGSGKEKLAQAAFHCREQPASPGKFVSTTLAGLDSVEAAKLLFHMERDSLVGVDYDGKNGPLAKYKPKEHRKDGLIFQALGGALFIDEIDKTDKGIRNLLLRVLESGEITVPGSSQILKIPPDKTPLYIFAGSMNRKSMFQESPPDFWTRITHVIEVAHPLGIDDLEKAKKVVKDYLWMFWCLHVKEFMREKGVRKRRRLDVRMKPLNDFYISLFKFLIDRTTVDFATEILAEEVSGRGKPLVSIRTLRSVVARSVFKLVDVLLYSKFDEDPIEIFKVKMRSTMTGKRPSNWFNLLLGIIADENKRKFGDPTEKKQKIDPVEFAVVESLRSAIRLGASLAQ